MRSVLALTSAAVLIFVTGIALAQDAAPAPDTAAPPATAAPAAAATPAAATPAAGAPAAGDTAAAPTATTTAAPPTDAAAAGEEETGAVAAPAAEDMDAGTYAVRLRDLEQRINELKEQIFRSKARLSLLAETVIGGAIAGAQATIVHENRMSSSYKLVKAIYALDGAPIFNQADEEGGLAERQQFDIYNGAVVPGEHTLTVNLEYRGHGYGIFSYLQGYRFRVRSNYSFTAPEGRSVTVRVVGYEKGGPTAPLEERPAVRYIERVANRGEADPTATEAAGAAGAPAAPPPAAEGGGTP